MKQCPACKTTYRDDSLSFCLQDGTALVGVAEEEPTVVRGGNDPMRVDIPPKTEVVPASRPTISTSASSSSTWLKVVIAAVVLLFVGIAALGLAGAAVYFAAGQKDPDPTPTRAPTPRPSPSANVDIDNERLKDVIANIQRTLEEQKRNANTAAPDDDDDRSSTVTGRVNSPNDGFLALRSIPDADRGARLLKIPHGATVDILNCEKDRVTISGRGGRWCQVEYDGVIGWVFDAWLIY